MKEYFKVIRKNIDDEICVRKMNNDEIDNSDNQHYCDDLSGCIYKEDELIIIRKVAN